MKTLTKHLRTCTLLLIGLLIVIPGIQAQENGSYFTINGVVKNKSNKKKLEHVTITVPGTSIATVTNTDGEFTLKIDQSIQASQIVFSLVGFYNLSIPFNRTNVSNETYWMDPKSIQLSEIVIVGWERPVDLVATAIRKVSENYSLQPNMITGFYRETAQKGRGYINIAEAIIKVYKTPYTEDYTNDRVQILKGRKLLSPKQSDTLAVKLLGGPNLSTFVDIVKNPDLLLSLETLNYFRFRMANPVTIDNQNHYVVEFEPQIDLPYALYYGKLYIDMETLAFSRAEFSLDMKDRLKATEMILKKKPSGLKFKPEEVSFIVTYKQRGDKSYLNYIRNEVRFKCDWKRRLFATNYTIVSEMVATDDQLQNVVAIPRQDAFKENQSLSDNVSNFYDPDFWGAYNIIEPTESLESAVGKLKKMYK